ncbi:hypothetical protein [Streptomyces sp. NPDC051665]|uniref:hypothetical protein n=1 Tax=Streptomyces sp. NPDC051665 TaxID=3154647 RepID=UPI00343EB418
MRSTFMDVEGRKTETAEVEPSVPPAHWPDGDAEEGHRMSRLLEAVCAPTVGVLVALLVWGADPGAVRVAWRDGELSGVTVVFVAACALWLVLWRRRTGRGWLAWLFVVLLCGAAVALVVAAMAG